MTHPRTWIPLLAALSVSACGGSVVSPDGGAGGSGGSATSSSSSSSASSSSSSSSSGGTCGDGCPPSSVCVSGACAPVCTGEVFEPCGAGLVCDTCATSSCPTCDDCIAACVPVKAGQCDEHDDCAGGDVCLYWSSVCAPACDPETPSCAAPKVCDPCATPACTYCSACIGACVDPD